MATQNCNDINHDGDEEPITRAADDENDAMSAEIEQMAALVANTIIEKAVSSLRDEASSSGDDGNNQENNNKDMDLLDVSYSDSFEASSEARTISEEEIEGDQSAGGTDTDEFQPPGDVNGLDFSGDLTDGARDGRLPECDSERVVPLIAINDERQWPSSQPHHKALDHRQEASDAYTNGDLNTSDHRSRDDRSDNGPNASGDDLTDVMTDPVTEMEAIENSIKVNERIMSVYKV